MNSEEVAHPREAGTEGPRATSLSHTSPRVLSLLQRFAYGSRSNHYVHMNQPRHMAIISGNFLQSKERVSARLQPWAWGY